VNKIELIEHVAKQADISRRLRGGRSRRWSAHPHGAEEGQLRDVGGFGTFSIGKRAARAGRNRAPARRSRSRRRRFPSSAGKALKDAVN